MSDYSAERAASASPAAQTSPLSHDRAQQMLSQACAGMASEHMHIEWGAVGEGARRIFISREMVIRAMRDAAVFAADQVVMPGTPLHARWSLLRSLTQGEASPQQQLEAAMIIRATLDGPPVTRAPAPDDASGISSNNPTQ